MKTSRQTKILEIIQSRDVETQNQLIEALRAEGYSSTQATVSRDIRELRLVKEMTDSGGYRYAIPSGENFSNYSDRLRTIFRESITDIAFAQNIVVLKTLPGLASAACSAIDSMEIKSIIGSLAGDDTAFLVMKDTQAAEVLCAEMKSMI